MSIIVIEPEFDAKVFDKERPISFHRRYINSIPLKYG